MWGWFYWAYVPWYRLISGCTSSNTNVEIITWQAFSAKKCDNFLVGTELFWHFRGIISWNLKRLQFHRNIKNNSKEAQFSKSSIPLCCPFLNWLICCFLLHRTKKISLWRLHCHFWWFLDKHYSFQKLACISSSSIWGGVWRANISHFNSFLLLDIIINSQWYEDNVFVKNCWRQLK